MAVKREFDLELVRFESGISGFEGEKVSVEQNPKQLCPIRAYTSKALLY